MRGNDVLRGEDSVQGKSRVRGEDAVRPNALLRGKGARTFLGMLRPSFALCVLLAAAPAAAETTPIERLTATVPEDAAAVLALEDLSGHWRRLRQSRFADEEGRRVVDGLWNLPELRRWRTGAAAAAVWLQLDPAEAFDLLAARAVAFSLHPGEGGRDRGLLSLHVADGARFDELVDRVLSRLGAESAGVRRVGTPERPVWRFGGEQPRFLARVGAVALVTDHEPLLRAALARAERPADGGLNAAEDFRAARMEIGTAVAWLFVRPRAFDDDLAAGAEDARGAERRVAEGVLRFWRSLHWTALGLRLADADVLAVDWHVAADADAAPPLYRAWHDYQGVSAAAWDRLPAGTLMAVLTRLDVPVTAAAAWSLVDDEETRRTLVLVGRLLAGYDPVAEVLPRLGPDLHWVIVGDDADLPAMDLRLRLQTGEDTDGRLPLPVVLEGTLHALMVVATADWLQRGVPLAVRLHEVAGARAHVFAGADVPAAGWGFLIDDRTLRLFSRGGTLPAGDGALATLVAAAPDLTPIALVHLTEAVPYVRDRLERWGVPPDRRERLARLLDVAGLADAAVFGQSRNGDVRTWSLRLIASGD